MFCGAAEDIQLFLGNNYPPIVWQFLVTENPDVLFDLAGSEFVLTVKWPGGTLSKDSALDAAFTVDLGSSTVTWAYTLAESRLLPRGRLSSYELERRINGSQQTFIIGHVVVDGSGSNVD